MFPDAPDILKDFLTKTLAYLTGPDGMALLILWASILAAVLITFLRTASRYGGVKAFWRHCVPEGVVTHPSARADFLFWLSRRVFMPLFVIPLSLSTVAAGAVAYQGLSLVFGPAEHSGPASPLVLLAFTLTMLIAYDLSYYIYHYLCHNVPMLWELHKVHHSAQVMIGVTKDRVHPIDEVLNRWWNGLIPGTAYGVWLFFALDPVELTVFGINVYMIRSLLMMDVVRHTHLKLSYGKWLNAVFLCPHYHQLHHSIDPAHYNRNYGLLLSVWDRWFGTLAVPEPNQDFIFGLANDEHDEYQSLVKLHAVPVRKMAALAARWVNPDRAQLGSSIPPPASSRPT